MPSAATKKYLTRLFLLGIGYTAVIYLSSFLIPTGGLGTSIVWPPSAIGLGALFLFGFDLWPAILIPVFLLSMFLGAPPPIAAGRAVANTAEALVATWILRRFEFRPMFDRLQDALIFSLAAVAGSLLSASIFTLVLHLFNEVPAHDLLWLGLWIGHSVSLVSFGSFAVRWGYKTTFTRTRLEWVEGVVMFGLFTVLTVFLYWTPFNNIGTISLLYVSIIPLIWAALRSGPRGVTLALALMAAIASTGVLWGTSSLAHAPDARQVLLSVQLIVGVLSVVFLLFTSIVEERKEAVIALRTNIDRLESALEQIRMEDQAKSDFIAILAHELRNPLSPILSGLELMKSRHQGPEDVLQMMGAHLHTMARLLDDLLDMSRISQKKFKLQREPVKLSTIINQSLEMIAPQIDERQHTLTVLEPKEDLWIDGDPVRLAQIIVNLLGNASKYTDRGGRIRLEARRDGDYARIEVSDTGIGIDPSRLKKVFEPFGATDSGIRRQGGLHIGLSLARRMAELHRGTIEAKSKGPGHGSTFIVRLPLLPTTPLITEEAPRKRGRFSEAMAGHSRSLGALNILIVDDNEAAADSLSQLLQHNGHLTQVAYDAPEALSLCEGYEPSVALLDIGLPTMDGYELARRLRQRFGNGIALVALTGYGQAEDKQKAKEAGFDDHLTKPVSIVDVERLLVDLSKS